ncbi:MAG: glucose/arabinose dehydrogenase [Saprospiraceae bacterium]|jgi:glucose/arabinose dehydrogenase
MKKFRHLLLILLVILFFPPCLLTAQIDLQLEEFANGFSGPLDLQHAGDDRLFVVEQNGAIKIIDADGNTLPTPFLDIDNIVNNNVNERGLLGLAFHPDYQTNGFFYVNYSNASGDTHISRFSVSADPNVADPDNEVVLMVVDQPFNNHNGGGLDFGPDGYLYIGLGDGGSGGDPQGNGQNTNTLLAKILRIDVDNDSPYAIPSDNPFVDDADILDEIWSIGMRNPWRFSFDRETGDLWIGDVGQNEFEEIDFEPADSPGGLNYGWRCYEGFSTFNTSGCGNASEYTDPAWDYANNNSVGRSVTGGYVYRGEEFPDLVGHYIYADFVSGRIWSLTPDGNGGWNNVELLNWDNNQIGSFGEDLNGEMYVVALQEGTVYKIMGACQAISANINFVPVTCFGDNDGALTISGLQGDYTVEWNTGATTFVIDNLPAGDYTATVTDDFGCTTEVSQMLEQPEEIVFELEIDDDGNVAAPEGFSTYQWYNEGGMLLENENNSTIAFQSYDSGFYVIVTNSTGCEYISPAFYIFNTNQIAGLTNFKISPNPFSNQLNLNLTTDEVLDLNLQIVTMDGKVLKEETFQVTGDYSKNMDLSDLPKGFYFLKLKQRNSVAVQRIMKQ